MSKDSERKEFWDLSNTEKTESEQSEKWYVYLYRIPKSGEEKEV